MFAFYNKIGNCLNRFSRIKTKLIIGCCDVFLITTQPWGIVYFYLPLTALLARSASEESSACALKQFILYRLIMLGSKRNASNCSTLLRPLHATIGRGVAWGVRSISTRGTQRAPGDLELAQVKVAGGIEGVDQLACSMLSVGLGRGPQSANLVLKRGAAPKQMKPRIRAQDVNTNRRKQKSFPETQRKKESAICAYPNERNSPPGRGG